MTKNKKWILGITFAVILIAGCSNSNDIIPITTNSEKALEYYNEGFTLSQHIQGQKAVYYFLKAIGEDPDFAMAYVQLALVQTTPKLAFKYLNKAKSLTGHISDGEKLTILAIEAGFNNELKKQNDYYLKLLEMYPNDGIAHSNYGGFLYQLAKYGDVIKHYKRAIQLNPDLTQAYNMLGYAYRQIGDYDKAEEYFKNYIELISDNPNPYDSYAELLLKKSVFNKSIEYYNKALEIQPTFTPSIIGIATNLTLMDRHEDACNELEKIADLTNDPGAIKRMHYAKAVVNVDVRNFERAIQEIKENISISKEIQDDLALGNDLTTLGTVYLMSGKYDDALKYFEKSLEYFERSNISQDLKYYLRRQLFLRSGRVAYLKNDIETLKKNKEKYESSATNSLNLREIRNIHELGGHINLLEGNYKDAIYEYNQANIENPVILYLTGIAYESLADYETARDIYYKVAHFNSLNDMNYAYIRKTALEKLNEF